MAFYQDDEENQDNQDAQGGVAVSGQSSTISGQGAAPQGASAPKAASAPDKSGNFVGIKQYLDANQRQAAKLGDQTAQVVDQSANQAKQSVNNLRQVADQKIQAVNPVGQDILGKLGAAETLTNDERNVLKSTANAKYTGPKNETELGDAYAQAQKSTKQAQDNVTRFGTEEGRMGLISQINAKPRTQGMNVFDNALVQAGGGREKIAQAAQRNQDVNGILDTAAQDIRKKIGDDTSGAIGQTKAAQSDAYNQIQAALTNWQNTFNPKVQQTRENLVNRQNNVLNDFVDNQYDLDEETLKEIGLDAGTRLYKMNLQDYLKPTGLENVTAANVATGDDYARYAALADLAGLSPDEMILKQENIGQAGKLPGVGFDKSKFMSDLAKADQDYQNLYDTYVPQGSDTAWGRFALAEQQSGNQIPLTAKYLENNLIPRLTNGSGFEMVDGAQQLMEDLRRWKEAQGYANVINSQDLEVSPVKPKLPYSPKI